MNSGGQDGDDPLVARSVSRSTPCCRSHPRALPRRCARIRIVQRDVNVMIEAVFRRRRNLLLPQAAVVRARTRAPFACRSRVCCTPRAPHRRVDRQRRAHADVHGFRDQPPSRASNKLPASRRIDEMRAPSASSAKSDQACFVRNRFVCPGAGGVGRVPNRGDRLRKEMHAPAASSRKATSAAVGAADSTSTVLVAQPSSTSRTTRISAVVR
jgi:hypothetical protein